MSIRDPLPSVHAALAQPRILHLHGELYAALFGSLLQMLPAIDLVRAAEAEGEALTLTVETTDAQMALALALACRARGHGFIAVSARGYDPLTERRLAYLGASVQPAAAGATPGATPGALARRLGEGLAFAEAAEIMSEGVGHIDCLIGPLEAAYALSGLGRFLRYVNPALRVIGVDVRGGGPPPAAPEPCDEIHCCDPDEAAAAGWKLLIDKGLAPGAGSAAGYAVADRHARRHPQARIMLLLVDRPWLPVRCPEPAAFPLPTSGFRPVGQFDVPQLSGGA
ncbi:hypothetical protein [Azorhizobium doebereinerae]|uniref:hypothetical protein n=1 Tax=Azorhizobium doebereinerae TaxID=281091 RepID=UPI00040D6CB3|nr:hypothetical protein [Azorhizobium doebereinerae]